MVTSGGSMGEGAMIHNRTKWWSTPGLLALCTMGACSDSDFAMDPEVGVTLRTERDSYLLGTSVKITLDNRFEDDVFYPTDWCGLELQRLGADGEEWEWVLYHLFDVPCVGQETLTPGASTSLDFATDRPDITAPAMYRFRLNVTARHRPPSVLLFSNAFQMLPER